MKCADCKVNYDLPISGCMYCKCRLCGNCYFAHLASEKKKKEDEPYNINLKTGIATFKIFNKSNETNLMLMWLATHEFNENSLPEKNLLGMIGNAVET